MLPEENSLVERINSISKNAQDNGWKITREAMASADSSDPSEELLEFLKIEFLKTEINVFDLYRRVERLADAGEMGKLTFDRCVTLGDPSLINRCGNFLTLVRSGEAYACLGMEEFEKAYKIFSEVEKTFGSMELEKSRGKDTVMYYSNRAANLLNMVNISVNQRIFVEEIDENLSSAEEYNQRSNRVIFNSDLSSEDESIWVANFYHNSGLIHQFRGDINMAIRDFRDALTVSRKGSGYNHQIIVLYIKLSDALLSTQDPTHIDEVRSNYHLIKNFISEKGGFGVYNPIINPLVKRIKIALE